MLCCCSVSVRDLLLVVCLLGLWPCFHVMFVCAAVWSCVFVVLFCMMCSCLRLVCVVVSPFLSLTCYLYLLSLSSVCVRVVFVLCSFRVLCCVRVVFVLCPVFV